MGLLARQMESRLANCPVHMELHFTEHALFRMAKRQIRRSWVEQTVLEPALVEPDEVDEELEHRLAVIPEMDDRVLRVIVSKDEPHRVITAHFDRKLKGRL